MRPFLLFPLKIAAFLAFAYACGGFIIGGP